MLPSLCKQVGHWRISREVIGSGTTSTVVLATHSRLPTLRAAVKVLSRTGLLIKANGDPTALHIADAVIHREVLLMKLAAHRHVVRLYDFVGHDDLAYMVLEHAPNRTLFDLFRASTSYLPPPLVAHIFSQVMQGLAYMHALQVVHRDLKLENIFLFGPDVKALLRKATTAEFSVLSAKIGDFGLSHIDDQMLSTVFHGSPHYQAPELWARVPHRPLPTDVWSAGVILYALQCRCLPFDLTALEDGAAALLSSTRKNPNNTRTSTSGSKNYMAYEHPDFMPEPTNRLLQRLFTLDPATRPTSRDVLNDPYFDSLPIPIENQDLWNVKLPAEDHNTDLYDLATLCISPGRHIPRDSFVGSCLERNIKERLGSCEDDIIGRWAQKLNAYITDKDAWDATLEARAMERERKTWSKSLGRVRAAEILERVEMNIAVLKPKLSTSLSFCNFRLKTVDSTLKVPSHQLPAAPSPSPASSSVAQALQDRREALLRRAYELGFGTYDLRAFADEAGRIVRVARTSKSGMGLEEIAREIQKWSDDERQVLSQIPVVAPPVIVAPISIGLVSCEHTFASTATTFVAENVARVGTEKEKEVMVNQPVAKMEL